jgi:TPP-dependent indolepyruvate ferredoxin oxidoreductase alpha subunit
MAVHIDKSDNFLIEQSKHNLCESCLQFMKCVSILKLHEFEDAS